MFSKKYFLCGSFALTTLVLLCSVITLRAQQLSVWHPADADLVLKDQTRVSTPEKFSVLHLDAEAMKDIMATAPMENLKARTSSQVTIGVPMPDGSLSVFTIWESPVMAPGLQAHYPGIRTYIAQGVTDPRAVGRIDFTNFGFHAMILSPRGTVFVDPVSMADLSHYISYYKQDLRTNRDFSCGVTAEDDAQNILHNHHDYAHRSSGTELREYRLALACTGEYAATKGGTVSGALSGMVTSLNRVDGIYEQEVGVRLTLIENDTLLIFTNSATDGYTNSNGSAMLDQNQSKCDNVIGTDNYDIGHVFSTGGGGIASLGCVCHSGSKAKGVTGSPSPQGDAFDVDYVAHEMGHQFGANHSFNSTLGSCGGGNRNSSTAFEPGSGSTIMSYAGICGNDDLQPHSDPFFHSGSFDEILDYTTLDDGDNCPVITSTYNTPPVVTVGGDYSIPISTPFRLDADASDADGDSLAYMFDEMDHGAACTWNNPVGQAPLFRSFDEDTVKYRYFPKLSTVVNNYPTSVKGEVLPDYGRTINFRFIARDHHAGGGGVTYNDDKITLTVVNTSTPFKVTFPTDAGITWAINTPWQVSWDVSSTDVSPINVPQVNILMSIDGGYTYPYVLASNTANDGMETVTLPNDNTLIGVTTARIMVQSVGNVFYDISDHNFTITNNVGIDETGAIGSQVHIYPNPAHDYFNVAVTGLKDETVTVLIRDAVGGVVDEQQWINAAGQHTFDYRTDNLPAGLYTIDVITPEGKASGKVMVMR